MRSLCLLIASLMLSGCGSLERLWTPPTKRQPLDTKLAQPCPKLDYPQTDDYDVWQAWIVRALGEYGKCAGSKAEIVEAWDK